NIHSRPHIGHDNTTTGDEQPEWVLHASAVLTAQTTDPNHLPLTPVPWPPPGTAAIEVDDFYDDLAAQGYNYGPTFQGVQRIWRDHATPDVIYAKLNYPRHRHRRLRHPPPYSTPLYTPTRPDPTPTNDTDDTNTADTGDQVRLPTLYRISLHATHATRLRVRLTRTAPMPSPCTPVTPPEPGGDHRLIDHPPPHHRHRVCSGNHSSWPTTPELATTP
ncbi:putative type I modular polyketide synthase, partial [Mycobacterium ulcerans str. Harvey]